MVDFRHKRVGGEGSPFVMNFSELRVNSVHTPILVYKGPGDFTKPDLSVIFKNTKKSKKSSMEGEVSSLKKMIHCISKFSHNGTTAIVN